jgi:hypothetical protein
VPSLYGRHEGPRNHQRDEPQCFGDPYDRVETSLRGLGQHLLGILDRQSTPRSNFSSIHAQ